MDTTQVYENARDNHSILLETACVAADQHVIYNINHQSCQKDTV